MANAKKVVLGKRPASFSKEVTFPMLDGSTGCILVDYVYRTRKEHAEFADGVQAGIDAKAKAEGERYQALAAAGEDLPSVKQADLVAFSLAASADTIMGCVKDWNLDIPFDREAVEQLVDELPAAATAIVASYREAITEGRLGN
ncbi:phage tail assembly chaperone [uncultured Massilia sp.]|uniref:phage tail assembly chaperone n=1 Tax=uncultured Massilia sp. TaxID=169973 RepID=UPI00258833E1|nr:phage tail assembly chaperone [uncultured Massilia sp.]